MNRRDFVAPVGAVVAFPRVAFAQQTQMKRLGVLLNQAEDDPRAKIVLDAFWAGAGKYGWSDRNLQGDYRFSATTPDTASGPAAELVGLKPDILFAATTPPVTALAKLTQSIPIVFAYVNGTTVSTLVQSFARPGGNITGFAYVPDSEVYGKNIDLLRELIPAVGRIALIYNPDAAVGGETAFLSGYVSLAAKQNLQVVPFPVRTPTDITNAVRSVAADPGLGLIVNGDAYMLSNRATAIAEVAKYRLVAVWSSVQSFATDGGLIVYAPDALPIYGGAGEYAGLILNGANPADLPVQTGQELLTVNLKTAKAQGIVIPESILIRADDVIE